MAQITCACEGVCWCSVSTDTMIFVVLRVVMVLFVDVRSRPSVWKLPSHWCIKTCFLLRPICETNKPGLEMLQHVGRLFQQMRISFYFDSNLTFRIFDDFGAVAGKKCLGILYYCIVSYCLELNWLILILSHYTTLCCVVSYRSSLACVILRHRIMHKILLCFVATHWSILYHVVVNCIMFGYIVP